MDGRPCFHAEPDRSGHATVVVVAHEADVEARHESNGRE
jgi:hypothetical protein